MKPKVLPDAFLMLLLLLLLPRTPLQPLLCLSTWLACLWRKSTTSTSRNTSASPIQSRSSRSILCVPTEGAANEIRMNRVG